MVVTNWISWFATLESVSKIFANNLIIVRFQLRFFSVSINKFMVVTGS